MLGSVKGNLGHLNTAAGEESKNHIQHFFFRPFWVGVILEMRRCISIAASKISFEVFQECPGY